MIDNFAGLADAKRNDPRGRSDGLGWVTRAIFPGAEVKLRLITRAQPAEAGHRITNVFAVVPNVENARFLLPIERRRVSAAAVLAYNALRAPKTRAARASVGALAYTGAASLMRFPRLQVEIPLDADASGLLLTARIAASIGVPRLHAAIGIRQPDPNHKPTLQLFDDSGRPRGYAKIGWNDATRALVRAEMQVLATIGDAELPTDYPSVPGVIHSEEMGERVIAVIDPLPPRVHRLPTGATPRFAEMLAVARGLNAPSRVRLSESSYLRRLSGQLDEAVADVGADAAEVRDALAALLSSYGDIELQFGSWHGDWAPWNMGIHRDKLCVWDWEHSAPDVPLGFDLVHEAFHLELNLNGKDAQASSSCAFSAAERHGHRLGLTQEQARLVTRLYFVELWLRTWRLHRAGAGWNAKLHPGLIKVINA